jgi:hypothetical protein
MSAFGPAVKALIEIAINPRKDWEMRQAAHNVLQTFDPKDTKAGNAALRALADGVQKAGPRGTPILLLAVGALVESGASPEVAWAAAEYDLIETLNDATWFSEACTYDADNLAIDEAIGASGAKIGKKHPREQAHWAMLRPRILTASACLIRSEKVRKKARALPGLVEAAAGLDELVEEVTWFNHALFMLEDVPLLVLHPETRRGWRMVMNDVTTNLDMFVLLLDALIGDPAKGMLPGTRPNAKAVRVLLDPDYEPKNPPEIKVVWNLLGVAGVLEDGSLADPQADRRSGFSRWWVWLESRPINIPLFGDERVVIFQPPVMKREYPIEPTFSSLSPRIQLKSKVPAAEVDRLIAKMIGPAKKARAERDAVDAAALAEAQKRWKKEEADAKRKGARRK